MQSASRHQRGFTLLEVVIAMTLSALLLAMLTAGMRMVVDQWQDANQPFEDKLDESLILLQIEQALLGAAPQSYIDQDTLEQNVFFAGGSESIAWVSTVSPQARPGMTVWLLGNGERGGLRLATVPALADDPRERLENATGTLLLPDFELELSYLRLDDLDRPEWLDEWDGAEYELLPMAVRLLLTNRERSGAPEIELIVPIMSRQHESIQPVDIE